MHPRFPLPFEIASEPFPVGQAFARGMGLGRLRGPDLQHPFWGVRIAGELPRSVLALATAYSVRMPARAFFSHVTAAQLWGIPLPARLQNQSVLDVSVPGGHFVPSGRGARGHRLQIDPQDVVAFGELRVSSLARTWCDLAAILNEEDLIAAGDFLIWRRRPSFLRLERGDLIEALARTEARRGRPLATMSVPRLTDRSDSPPESTMRVRFVHAGLPQPEVNPMVYTSDGVFVAMPDLGFVEFRVAFDYEGDHHRSDAVQWGKDLKRPTRFEDAGWSYLRGGAPDLRDSTELIDLLKSRLRARGWQG